MPDVRRARQSLSDTMISVSSGRRALNPAKINWNRGMKNTSRNTSTAIASSSRMAGYRSAVRTLAFISFSRAWKSAICERTSSRKPPVSPASTMAT
jgi:hypothetical protein